MARISKLFCYGTLCFPDIMRSVTGVVPGNCPASLDDYACYELYGVDYPAIVPDTGACVTGILYSELSPRQLRRLDHYESSQYERVLLDVIDNQLQKHKAWVYVLNPRYCYRLRNRAWSLELFASNHLEKYISRHGWR